MRKSSFTGPMELLSFAQSGSFAFSIPGVPQPGHLFEIEYVAETHDPIVPIGGPRVLPSKTFDEVASKQFDIILVPGGNFGVYIHCLLD